MTFVVDCLRFKSVVLFVSCSGAAVVGAALRRTIGDLVMVMVAVVAGVDKVSIGSTVDEASFVDSVPVSDHGVVSLAAAVGTVVVIAGVDTVSIGSTVDGASFVDSVPVLDHGVVFLAVAVGTVRLVGFVSTRV